MKISRSALICYILLLVILSFSVYLRFKTFDYPKGDGDQLYYIALAYKLDKYGFSEYNLRWIDVKPKEFYYQIEDSKEEKGNLLRGFEKEGIFYYDEPLYHLPPLFSYSLAFSHRIFQREEPYAVIHSLDFIDPEVRKFYPEASKLQFYAQIVPTIFSLLLILATFTLGSLMFDMRIGLLAAFFLSVNPVELITSAKIWADDMTAFFVTSSVLIFYLSQKKEKLYLSAIAGIFGGLALLSKPSGGLIALAISGYVIFSKGREILRNPLLIFDKNLFVFGVFMTLTTLPWFLTLFKTYGSFLYKPKVGVASQTSHFLMVSKRPWYLYIVGIPYIMPIFAFVYPMILLIFKDKFESKENLLLVLWFLVFCVVFSDMRGKEHRYMLPAYPALALLSAQFLERLREEISRLAGLKELSEFYGDVSLLGIVLPLAYYSLKLGWEYVVLRVALILKPF